MHHLLGRKVIITLAVLIFGTVVSSAQLNTRDNYNYLGFKNKPYYFGMTFGSNFSNYRIKQSKFFIGNDSIRITEGARRGGGNIHLVTNLKLGEYFDFRFTPGFTFSYRSFNFNQDREVDVESVYLDMPFTIRYKSTPYKNKRVFTTAGIKYAYDVQSNSQSRQANTLIKITPHDYQWEVGVGMQFFYPFFIFSPEIKYSRGLGNILIYNGELNDAKVLENVVSQTFSISFSFEG